MPCDRCTPGSAESAPENRAGGAKTLFRKPGTVHRPATWCRHCGSHLPGKTDSPACRIINLRRAGIAGAERSRQNGILASQRGTAICKLPETPGSPSSYDPYASEKPPIRNVENLRDPPTDVAARWVPFAQEPALPGSQDLEDRRDSLPSKGPLQDSRQPWGTGGFLAKPQVGPARPSSNTRPGVPSPTGGRSRATGPKAALFLASSRLLEGHLACS